MKVSKETWIRSAILLVTLINQILTAVGKNPLPFSEDQAYQGLSAIITAVAGIWSWWKNNSFTTAAILADAYKDRLKEQKKNG